MPDELSDFAEELIEGLPEFMQEAKEIEAVMDVMAREVARIEASIEDVRAAFFPVRAALYLEVWERLLGLAVADPTRSLADRRNSLRAFLWRVVGRGTGTEWEENMSLLLGSDWTYQEHDPADLTSPAPYQVRVLIPFMRELASPTSLTRTVFSSGGSLPAGTYSYLVTATNQFGETPAIGNVSATVTGSASRVVLDWHEVTDATGYHVYRGAPGAERLLASVVTSAYTDAGTAIPVAQPVPTVNSTKSRQAYEAERLVRTITPAHIDLVFSYTQGFILGVSRLSEESLGGTGVSTAVYPHPTLYPRPNLYPHP